MDEAKTLRKKNVRLMADRLRYNLRIRQLTAALQAAGVEIPPWSHHARSKPDRYQP
jgi:hypothetical protein